MSVWEYLPMFQDQEDLMLSKVQKPFLKMFANVTCPFCRVHDYSDCFNTSLSSFAKAYVMLLSQPRQETLSSGQCGISRGLKICRSGMSTDHSALA